MTKQKQLRDILISDYGFNHIIEKDIFRNYQMEYLVRNAFILFFNTPEPEYTKFLGESFLMGYGETRMNERNVVTFRWTQDIEEIKRVYEAVTGENFEL